MNTRVPQVSGEAQKKERRTRSRVTATSLALLSSAGDLHRALHVVFRIKPNSSPQTCPVQPHSYTLHSCQSSLSYTHTLHLSLSLPPSLGSGPTHLVFPNPLPSPHAPHHSAFARAAPSVWHTLPSPLPRSSLLLIVQILSRASL